MVGGELECIAAAATKEHIAYRIKCRSCILDVMLTLSFVTGETVFRYGTLPYRCYNVGYVFKLDDLLYQSAHYRMLHHVYRTNMRLFWKLHAIRIKFGLP